MSAQSVVLIPIFALLVIVVVGVLLWTDREVCDDPGCRRLACRWRRR